MTGPCISVILPVYNEEGNIAACLRGLAAALKGEEHEILVCYDFDEDKTLPAIAAMEDKPASVKLVRNSLGRGVAFAIRAGLQAARGDVLVTTMADLSDPPEAIPAMARKIRVEGADVVSGSRYMKGGSQTGGPKLKTLMSRAAGLSLHHVAGVGTHDATTNFRAYSRRFIQHVEVESKHGFELALELTVKAHLKGFKVDEVPSSWRDRTAGESRFKLWSWLPRYLRWYLAAMGAPLFVGVVLLLTAAGAMTAVNQRAPRLPFWPDEWRYVPEVLGERPAGVGWLFAFHNEHRIPLPKLIWLEFSRASGFDGRWLGTLNVLLMAVSAALLCRGLKKLRGLTRWSDAFVPLLLLHAGHLETLAWPFQISFTLIILLQSLGIYAILSLRGRDPDASSPLLGFCLLLMPFCGASTFPFVLLLAPWLLVISRRDPKPGRRHLSMGLAAAALLLVPLYFGYERPAYLPPSPGIGATLSVAFQTFAGSLGFEGNRHWTLSGWIACIVAFAAAFMILRGRRRVPDLRRPATGMLLFFAALVGLALIVGHTRAGAGPFSGFLDRYVTLFCLAPFVAFASADLSGRPAPARWAQVALLLPMMALFSANQQHDREALALKRYAGERLRKDLWTAMPLRILARRHVGAWCPGELDTFEHGLELLARSRASIYHDMVAPHAPNQPLVDNRIPMELLAKDVFLVEMKSGNYQFLMEYGALTAGQGSILMSARVLREGSPPETVWTEVLDRTQTDLHTSQFRYHAKGDATLELRTEPVNGGPLVAQPVLWMLLKFSSAGP